MSWMERRRARKEDERAWRRRWRSVPHPEQRTIEAAVRRGKAVEDAALAGLAAERAAHGTTATRLYPWLAVAMLALAAFWLADSFLGNDEDALSFILPAGYALVGLAWIAATVMERRRLARAEAANRKLARRQEDA